MFVYDTATLCPYELRASRATLLNAKRTRHCICNASTNRCLFEPLAPLGSITRHFYSPSAPGARDTLRYYYSLLLYFSRLYSLSYVFVIYTRLDYNSKDMNDPGPSWTTALSQLLYVRAALTLVIVRCALIWWRWCTLYVVVLYWCIVVFRLL